MVPLRLSFTATLLLVGTLCLSSCGSKETEPTPPTLYERIGGLQGVTNIVDKLMANVVAETTQPNSVMLRSHTDLLNDKDPNRVLRLRNNFIDQLGETTGGPLVYKGLSMLSAHKGMMITEKEFAVWRQAADASMEANKLGAQEKAELATILDDMKAATVGH